MKATKTITLGGGCFWCTEAVFLNLKGVISVKPGYSGGTIENPTYEQVCTGRSGHAEVIQIELDPEQIALEQILEIFFATHDPTTLNRQGADTGTQYRSVIFYLNQEEKEIVERIIEEKNKSGEFNAPIVTTLEEFKEFYEAEDYHQNYYENNPGNMYCSVMITPKLKKLMEKYPELVK